MIIGSPVKDTYELCLKTDINGRSSWDQTAVLVGVRGYENYFHAVCGKMLVLQNGDNT